MRVLLQLLEKARKLPPPTQREREQAALCFAYGNLALTTNHRPKRYVFWEVARVQFGWSREEFDVWAEGREWVS